MTFLNGYKTYIVAGATILYAVVQYWDGASDGATAMLTILAALGMGSMRHALSAGGKS